MKEGIFTYLFWHFGKKTPINTFIEALARASTASYQALILPWPRVLVLVFFFFFCSNRLVRFLGVLIIEAFAASAMGMLIGCLAKDGDAAMAIGPPIMTIFILFSGGL